jgi:hypothetical protein
VPRGRGRHVRRAARAGAGPGTRRQDGGDRGTCRPLVRTASVEHAACAPAPRPDMRVQRRPIAEAHDPADGQRHRGGRERRGPPRRDARPAPAPGPRAAPRGHPRGWRAQGYAGHAARSIDPAPWGRAARSDRARPTPASVAPTRPRACDPDRRGRWSAAAPSDRRSTRCESVRDRGVLDMRLPHRGAHPADGGVELDARMLGVPPYARGGACPRPLRPCLGAELVDARVRPEGLPRHRVRGRAAARRVDGAWPALLETER